MTRAEFALWIRDPRTGPRLDALLEECRQIDQAVAQAAASVGEALDPESSNILAADPEGE